MFKKLSTLIFLILFSFNQTSGTIISASLYKFIGKTLLVLGDNHIFDVLDRDILLENDTIQANVLFPWSENLATSKILKTSFILEEPHRNFEEFLIKKRISRKSAFEYINNLYYPGKCGLLDEITSYALVKSLKNKNMKFKFADIRGPSSPKIAGAILSLQALTKNFNDLSWKNWEDNFSKLIKDLKQNSNENLNYIQETEEIIKKLRSKIDKLDDSLSKVNLTAKLQEINEKFKEITEELSKINEKDAFYGQKFVNEAFILNSLLADLGFIIQTLKSLKNCPITIIYTGNKHSTRGIIDFFSNKIRTKYIDFIEIKNDSGLTAKELSEILNKTYEETNPVIYPEME
jgi:hypothetical protein